MKSRLSLKNIDYVHVEVILMVIVLVIAITIVYRYLKMRGYLNISRISHFTGTTSVAEQTEVREPTELTMFYTTWCGHSQKMLPIWEKIKKKHKERVITKLVDCDDDTENLCGQYQIRYLPTIILERMKEGKPYKAQYNLGPDFTRFDEWILSEA